MEDLKTKMVARIYQYDAEKRSDLLAKKGFYESQQDYDNRVRSDLESKDEDELMNIIKRAEGDGEFAKLRAMQKANEDSHARSDVKLGEVS